MTYGVIDVGSNTIRLVIYELKENRIESLFSNKNTAGLIGYVNDGELSRKGIRKACDVLNSLQKVAAHAQVEKLYVFATASLRNIANTKEAVEEIEKETGLDIDVISGHDEAVLDFEGAAHAQKLKDGVMVDIGGGSTEVVAFADGKITDAVSLLFESEEKILQKLNTLDLFNVSEIKRPKGGGMEIKFFDRLKAIDKIREMVNEQTDKSPTSFYEALEKSTQATKRHYTEEFDE